MSKIKEMVNLIKSSKNPQSMIQSMINQNPQMKQVMEMVNKNGGNPKDAFYALAKQKGVNPDDILNMLK